MSTSLVTDPTLMTSSYEIVRYDGEHRPQILELQKHLWGPDVRLNSEYFSWKYEQNPFTDNVLAILAIHRGQLAGMRGLVGSEWRNGSSGETYNCFCACDLVVAPEHRRRGLFLKLMNAALNYSREREAEVITSFSASPITYLASLRSGWRLIEPYRTLRWETGYKMLSERLREKLRGTPIAWRWADTQFPVVGLVRSSAFQRLGRFVQQDWPTSMSITFEEEARLEEMTALAQRGINDKYIAHVKDAKYIAWRYKNPRSRYCFLYEGKPLRGYLVLQMDSNSIGEAAIVDWEASDAETFARLVKTTLDSEAFHALSIWSTGLPTSFLSALLTLGFTEADETRGIDGFQPGLIVRSLVRDSNSLRRTFHNHAMKRGNWNLRMANSDYY